MSSDIERNDREKSPDDSERIEANEAAPYTPVVFKHQSKARPSAPTLETIPTRTDSDPSLERRNEEESHPRQVIAVSVSKGPSAFFNLARKFLVTDEECDLSALEGAIVSAVDAAHLLERSKIATISRVQTSYVTVDPKKKKESPSAAPEEFSERYRQAHQTRVPPSAPLAAAAQTCRENIEHALGSADPHPPHTPTRQRGSPGPLRRARIVITVQRTEEYKKWLAQNPVHDVISGEEDDRI